MIPQRILVKGFLSYRDEQEVAFDGGSLWMLAGPNGSGKSTLFDAVTYALFGQHRGGRQNAKELINKDSDGLVVEFDFTLDGQLYQARRTLKRKTNRSTRQISRWNSEAAANGKRKWEPVPDTSYDDGFSEWVREHIGLTYETFTSSVLLLQGKAEKLLAAEPVERFKVLAGIVDLGRYQRLHERADTKRREFEATCRSFQQQLDTLPEVADEELQDVERRREAAAQAKEQVQAEVERLQRLEVQAERWADLQARLAEARTQWDRAEGLLRQAAALEADWNRLTDLRRVLPHLETVVNGQARLAETVQLVARLEATRSDLAARLEELDGVLEQTRQKRELHRQAVTEDEDHEAALSVRLRELSGLLARAVLCEQQRAELVRLEAQLAELPGDLSQRLERLRQEHEGLMVLGQALPLLRRLHLERNDLNQAREQGRTAAEAAQAAWTLAEERAAECAELTRQAEAAAQVHAQAREHATEARTLLKEATEELKEFGHLAGAKTCRHCGQALTPRHYELEKARRLKARTAADAAYRHAEETCKAAAGEEKGLLDRRQAVTERLSEAREQVREYQRRSEQAERDAQRHQRECAQAYRDLGEPFRSRVSAAPPTDWPATTYPTASDLEDAQRQAQQLAAVRRRLEETKTAFERWNDLNVRATTIRQTLTDQEAELPADLADLRREAGELEAEHTALRRRLTAARAQVRQEQDLLDRRTGERQELSQQLADQDRQLQEQRVRRQSGRETVAAALGFLPPAWQLDAAAAGPADLQRWQAECKHLEERGLAAQLQALQGARQELEVLRQRKAELERSQEEVPAEARCAPTDFDQRIRAARQEQAAREVVLGQIREEGVRLAQGRQQREERRQQLRQADRQHTLYRTLTEHLGRKGLQLHLMRQAERGIIDFANTVLDRLSGGQFCLRLRGEETGDDTEQALQLEAYDRRRGQVFSLPFLSGSQRFRVAVSLALGVGQYASRQHRPIESVIIDEGFGCLDREGRQIMIQEMLNLRSQLRCILLVSHQEEFADAFADCYRFELADGTTAVTRWQR